jgi:helix-turn-helix protein
MPKETAGSAAAGDGQRLLTLTEVAKQIKASMPTLQKYKKRYGDRIPSVGKGRTQRYPESALPVFEQLRKENLARRGRPRKNAAASPGAPAPAKRRGRPRKAAVVAVAAKRRPGRPRKAAAAVVAAQVGAQVGATGGGEGLLTLTQIAGTTGISYPTLLRYVKLHGRRLPSVGRGRRRRFKPEAVAAFQQLRSESRRGRKPGSTVAKRRGRPPGKAPARRGRPPGSGLAAAASTLGLAAILRSLEKRLAGIESALKTPFRLVRG